MNPSRPLHAVLILLLAAHGCAGPGDGEFRPGPDGASPALVVDETEACDNGQLDAGESDVDCGGPCSPCAENSACVAWSDCLSGLCSDGRCGPTAAASCTDGVLNQDESDTDCGGPCEPCDDQQACLTPTDCASSTCDAGVCISCSDGERNGSETAVDCGGSCGPCALGEACTQASDCSGGGCSGGVCCTANACGQCETSVEVCDGVDNDCNGQVDDTGSAPLCPSGQICESGTCQAGCLHHSMCPDGEVCKDGACVSGCLNHSECPQAHICEDNTCVPGCVLMNQCPDGTFCHLGQCIPGCTADADCAQGEICQDNACVEGCWNHSGCPVEHVCVDNLCVEGCGLPGAGPEEAMPERCAVGEACRPMNCGASGCEFTCGKLCSGWPCHATDDEPWACVVQDSSSICRLACTDNADCEEGQRCAKHSQGTFCRTKCESALDCKNMTFASNTFGMCSCAGEEAGVHAGMCYFGTPGVECTFQ